MIPLLFEIDGGFLVVAVKHLGWKEYDCRWWGNEISHKQPKILSADVDIEEEHKVFMEDEEDPSYNALAHAKEYMKEILFR